MIYLVRATSRATVSTKSLCLGDDSGFLFYQYPYCIGDARILHALTHVGRKKIKTPAMAQ